MESTEVYLRYSKKYFQYETLLPIFVQYLDELEYMEINYDLFVAMYYFVL